MGIDTFNNQNTAHYLKWYPEPWQWPELNTPFVLRSYTMSAVGGPLWIFLYKQMETERWYCFEIYIKSVGGSEEWHYRLDGVDVTGDFIAVDDGDKTLLELYAEGTRYPNKYHGNLWMATYDNKALDEGYDFALVEVRDDRWPGLVDGSEPPTDNTPPTGSIETTGVDGRTDKTGTTAVTPALSATDTGSGMGIGAQMRFSNDGVTWSSPEPYAQSKAWTLLNTAPGTEQTRIVYVKFKDVAGNWSNAISDSIILDRQPPSAPRW